MKTKLICLSLLALFFSQITYGNGDLPTGLLKIRCEFERAEGQDPLVHETLGFMMEESGYLMSTYKELVDPETGRLSGEIEASFLMEGNMMTLPAEVVAVEAAINFSILRVNHSEPVPVAEINRDRELDTGEVVHAYHVNDTGVFEPILGSFSELNQLECYEENLTATMLKTEIKLPGDSVGSPILDSDGKVFAMHTAHVPDIDEDELQGEDGEPEIFLLSMDLAMNLYDSIKRRPSMKTPWTGFSVRSLTEDESKQFPLMGGKVMCGIGLEHIWEGGPAEAMGIQPGDILIKFGYYPICSVSEFQKWLYMYGVDQPVTLYFIRDGELKTFEYLIEERPASVELH